MTPEQALKILAQPGMPKTSPIYRMALEALKGDFLEELVFQQVLAETRQELLGLDAKAVYGSALPPTDPPLDPSGP